MLPQRGTALCEGSCESCSCAHHVVMLLETTSLEGKEGSAEQRGMILAGRCMLTELTDVFNITNTRSTPEGEKSHTANDKSHSAHRERDIYYCY